MHATTYSHECTHTYTYNIRTYRERCTFICDGNTDLYTSTKMGAQCTMVILMITASCAASYIAYISVYIQDYNSAVRSTSMTSLKST